LHILMLVGWPGTNDCCRKIGRFEARCVPIDCLETGKERFSHSCKQVAGATFRKRSQRKSVPDARLAVLMLWQPLTRPVGSVGENPIRPSQCVLLFDVDRVDCYRSRS